MNFTTHPSRLKVQSIRTGSTRRRLRTVPFAALAIVYAVCTFLITASYSAIVAAEPICSENGMIVSASGIASEIGANVLRDGGNAVDAAVATAFALAVTHPAAGNVGGGGFLVFRSANGEAVCYDFREMAPAGASSAMFLKEGKYDFETHHNSYIAVGVPGTVAGLHLAWSDRGKLPWRRLVAPAIDLARDGFPVTRGLAASLNGVLNEMKKYPASYSQFSIDGRAYKVSEILKQPDLAKTLERIAEHGPAGFYAGETAVLIEQEMKSHGGLITREDLKAYEAKRREPVRGTYRGYDIISMPPPSSGGTAIVQMLNILEGYDLESKGYGSSQNVHLIAEAMRRAFADRAQHLGDPDFNPEMPVARLTSKDYSAELRLTINPDCASKSSPETFAWPHESDETTHLSVVDAERNAVALTYTLEESYGSKIVVPGAGFLLNNEMGDFNAAPDLTTTDGLIGTAPNLAAPRKRMLSSMSPTIVVKDGKLFMVTGSPGGRTIINTVLLTIVNAIDFGMNAQEAVDAGRFHHQWLPDRIVYERFSLSPDTATILKSQGHHLIQTNRQGVAEVIVHDADSGLLQGGLDRRQSDGGIGVQ